MRPVRLLLAAACLVAAGVLGFALARAAPSTTSAAPSAAEASLAPEAAVYVDTLTFLGQASGEDLGPGLYIWNEYVMAQGTIAANVASAVTAKTIALVDARGVGWCLDEHATGFAVKRFGGVKLPATLAAGQVEPFVFVFPDRFATHDNLTLDLAAECK